MDNRPIGIFDSGVGGLSAVRALMAQAPAESFTYFGDTARVPYGDRTADNIRQLSRQNGRFLRTKGVKALLVACNTTASAGALPLLQEDSGEGIPVLGVVQPSSQAAVDATRSGRIGVIATNATINSGIYARTITELLPSAAVTSMGCPRLVPLIEAGHISPADPLLREAVTEYLRPLREAAVDTVILGCTHYPLIADAVREIMGGNVTLIDSGAASIGTLMQTLAQADALSGMETGSHQYHCSAQREQFITVATAFLGQDISGQTTLINIETY